mmetsp:Transcript_47657/g.70558  ORF Transcript_47657/g.70558 Transcript_47657/m.70558 type:complete len:123 (-) Transcript_47657:57-425(-)
MCSCVVISSTSSYIQCTLLLPIKSFLPPAFPYIFAQLCSISSSMVYQRFVSYQIFHDTYSIVFTVDTAAKVPSQPSGTRENLFIVFVNELKTEHFSARVVDVQKVYTKCKNHDMSCEEKFHV